MAIGSYNLAVLIFEMNYSALPGSVDYLVIANSYYSSSLPFTSLYFPEVAFFALYRWRISPGSLPRFPFSEKTSSANSFKDDAVNHHSIPHIVCSLSTG